MSYRDASLSTRLFIQLLSRLDTAGTCSMLPKDKNGVVDPDLKVRIRQTLCHDEDAKAAGFSYIGIWHEELTRRRPVCAAIANRVASAV